MPSRLGIYVQTSTRNKLVSSVTMSKNLIPHHLPIPDKRDLNDRKPDELPRPPSEYCPVSYALHEYEESKITDQNLWELFRDGFEGFTVETFRKGYQTKEQQLLRSYLHRGGVYVKPTANGHTIAQSLVNVLEQEAMEQWNDPEIVELSTIGRDFLAGPITSVFLTLNGYEYGKTNIVPPPPAPPAGTAPPPPRKVEVQAQAPQPPSFATPPAPPHAGVPPFQYPPPLAPPEIPSFPPDQRQFAIHARTGWSGSSLGRLVVSAIRSLARPHLHLHSNSPPPHLHMCILHNTVLRLQDGRSKARDHRWRGRQEAFCEQRQIASCVRISAMSSDGV